MEYHSLSILGCLRFPTSTGLETQRENGIKTDECHNNPKANQPIEKKKIENKNNKRKENAPISDFCRVFLSSFWLIFRGWAWPRTVTLDGFKTKKSTSISFPTQLLRNTEKVGASRTPKHVACCDGVVRRVGLSFPSLFLKSHLLGEAYSTCSIDRQ